MFISLCGEFREIKFVDIFMFYVIFYAKVIAKGYGRCREDTAYAF